MSSYVLDSSVVLAIFGDEPGGDSARAEMDGTSVISAVNLIEVVSKLHDFGWTEARIEDSLVTLLLDVTPLSQAQAVDAGLLRRVTRHLGLSLGDRACFALAREMQLPILTADRAWVGLDLGVKVRSIR